jgi:hypothetical protein
LDRSAARGLVIVVFGSASQGGSVVEGQSRRVHQAGARRDHQGGLAEPQGDRDDAVMVVIMTLLLGVFFFGIDTVFSQIVKFLLSLAS